MTIISGFIASCAFSALLSCFDTLSFQQSGWIDFSQARPDFLISSTFPMCLPSCPLLRGEFLGRTILINIQLNETRLINGLA